MKKANRLFQILLLVLVAVIGFTFTACTPNEPTPITGSPENGIYYFDAGSDEYTVALSAGNRFTLNYEGESKSGSYTLKDEELTLDFDLSTEETIKATLSSDSLVLNYDDATIRFLKKVNYAITFDVNEGSEVVGVTVLNGKMVTKPADPTRNGYKFVGWYADDEFTTPYAFDANIVSKDTTIYARWVKEVEGAVSEYVVDFDLGYDADGYESLTTLGGQVFDLPTPTRTNYDFKGWWISYTEDGNALSYKYVDGMVFDAHTTLFALWQEKNVTDKLAYPVVEVTGKTIKWDAVTGATGYDVAVYDKNNELVYSTTSASTLVEFDFDLYDAGDYIVAVTAVSSDVNKNAQAVRLYKNNALNRVSLIEVFEPSMLVFTGVPNAEKYLITVAYNGEQKYAKTYDNGNSTTFNFANVEMKVGGIDFYVTAIADGYASTTSELFNYNRVLNEVGELNFDEETQTVSWSAVLGATGYMVSVSSDENDEFVNYGNVTSISLKEYAGNVTVKVYPVAKGYNSPKTATLAVAKTTIATPANVFVNGNTVSWDEVTGATSYEVKIGTEVYTSTETSFVLPENLTLVQGNAYAVSVRAKGESESLWSDEIVASYGVMTGKLTYAQGVLSWNPVFGATEYYVSVNGGNAIAVNTNSTEIEWTKAGENTVKVWCSNEEQNLTATVNAYSVILDSVGGNIAETQYKVVGDKINFPAPEKEGYTFANWYDSLTQNGSVYADEYFNESGDVVLYAHYTPNEYNVTYDFCGGGSANETAGTVNFGKEYSLVVPTVNDATSAFGGWYSAPNGEGVRYTDAQGNSLTAWNVASDTQAYAFWIEDVLKYTKTKYNGNDVYAVMQGDRLAYVDEVTIPASYEGLPVAIVSGNAFKNAGNLVTINLPNTIQSISTVDTFMGCVALQNVNVYEVAGNSVVTYVSVNGVVYEKIQGTENLKVAVVPSGKTGTITLPSTVTEIPARAFKDSVISKVVIPASVTKIGTDAFMNAVNLNEVVFASATNESDLTIEARAFNGCVSLKQIQLPKRLINISLAKYALSTATGTPAVQNVEVSETVDAFNGCNALTQITVAKGNKNYSAVDGVIYNAQGTKLLYAPASLTGEFEVPDAVTEIANGAFANNEGITSVVIPGTVEEIGECAFYSCDALNAVVFEQGFVNVTIGKYAFRDCAVLTEINYKSGSMVASVQTGAFMNCTKLVDVTIPSAMEFVGDMAFRGCSVLENVTFAPSTKDLTFGNDVFYDCIKIKSITLPDNAMEVPGIFSGCISLEEVIVSGTHPYLASQGGVLYNKELTEILFCPQGKSGDFEIPDGVTKIGNGVFRGTRIVNVVIPNTVTEIGSDAFREMTALRTVSFAGEVANGSELTIGGYAFYGSGVNGGYSTSYTLEIALPSHTVSIGEYAFAKIASNELSVTMNEGLKTIGEGAFHSSIMSSVAIPSTVTEIPDDCFNNNTSTTFAVTFAPNSQVTAIGKSAFYSSKIKNIEIPKTVESIGERAFYQNNTLESFTFEQGSVLKTIGSEAFYYAGIGTYDYATGMSKGMVDLVLPNTVTSVSAYAFSQCYFNSIVFEEDGTEDLVLGTPGYRNVYDYDAGGYIDVLSEGHVFDNARYLTYVYLPSRLTSLGEYAFYYAGLSKADYSTYPTAYTSLFELEFGENSRLTHISAHAFEESTLATITIPKSVANRPYSSNMATGESKDLLAIEEYAFAKAKYLKEVNFEQGGTGDVTLGKFSFLQIGENNANVVVNLPARIAPYVSYTGEIIQPLANGAEVFSTTIIEPNSYGGVYTYQYWSKTLSAINVEEGGQYLASDGGILYSADMSNLILCPMNKSGEITVPASVKTIGDNAFLECKNVTKIVITPGEEDVTIGYRAFYNASNVTEIDLPDNVVAIGKEAFSGCASLQTLVLAKGLENFDGTMIEGCNSLVSIVVKDGNEKFVSEGGVLFNADKTVLITYPAKSTETEYTLPETVKVISYGAFKGASNLRTVVLNSGLVEIGDKAFYQAGITAVTIPATVTTIGADAFNGYSLRTLEFEEGGNDALVIGNNAFIGQAIESINLPARLVEIGASAFQRVAATTINFAEDTYLEFIGDGAFAETKFTAITIPYVKVMGIRNITPGSTIGVFYRNTNLKTVTFEEGLVELGDKTFSACTALETVYFPATLESMGAFTFNSGSGLYSDKCTALKKVTFATGCKLEVIPVGTFAGAGLVSITIPASVKVIEDAAYNAYGYIDANMHGAFEECASLEAVIFENGSKISHIGKNAFAKCTSLKYVTIPSTVSAVEQGAFKDCLAIESLVIPSTVTKFGEEAFAFSGGNDPQLSTVLLESKATELSVGMFRGAKNLKTLVVPETVKTIGDYCFENSGIEHIVIPENVTKVGTHVFNNCTSLKSVTILGKIETLPQNFFAGCTALESVKFPSTLKTIEVDAFKNCSSFKVIYLPASLTKLENAFAGSGIEGYVVEEGNTTFAAIDGVLLSADKSAIMSYPAGKMDAKYTVPNTIVAIADELFANNTVLEEVVFEEGGTVPATIGAKAFYNCKTLKKVVLSDRVTDIGESAFEECTALASVRLSNSIEVIPARLFYNCSALAQVNLPNKVITISGGSFYYCTSLVTIEVPASCKEIANGNGSDSAFYNCTKLMEVGNFSTLNIVAGEMNVNGNIAQYAERVYVEGGSSIVTDADGYMTMTKTVGEGADAVTSVLLVGYSGSATDLVTPAGVTEIYRQAFKDAIFNSVTISEGVIKVGDEAFNQTYSATKPDAIKSLSLPSTLQYIGRSAFNGMKGITSINIPGSVKEISDSAFNNCTAVTSLTLNEGTEIIGNSTFYGLAIEKLTLPSSLTTIKSSAFNGCTKLKDVVIPSTVTTMDGYVFSGCTNLVVFCEVEEANKPAGWNYSWNSGVAGTYYGFKNAVAKYTFVTGYESEGMVIADVETATVCALPVLSKEGMVFNGWYTNSDFSGTKLTGSYYNAEGATLYARWFNYDEWVASLDGATRETAFLLELNKYSSYTAAGYTQVWFQFTPTENGVYYVPQVYNAGTSMYTAQGGYMSSIWDTSLNISTYELTAGVTYCVQMSPYMAGTYSITICKK